MKFEKEFRQGINIRPKPKRNKLQIYNDILCAISLELSNGVAKPTRVQTLSNLAYDKLVRYLNELQEKEMILQNPLRITEKGLDFLQGYDWIREGYSLNEAKVLAI
jgi:predicted transcriptional regulator